jgi:hypothetical protein
MTMRALLCATAGFLLGVLWMDLLFDTQMLRGGSAADVATIAAYYRHATIEAYPMNRLIAAMMLLTVIGAAIQVVRTRERRRDGIALTLAALAVVLALSRVVPNAMRLGGGDPAGEQSALAWSICVDHFICLGLMLAFVLIQARASSSSP